MKRILRTTFLLSLLWSLAACGENLSTSPVGQNSVNLNTEIRQVDYQYSLETDKEVRWSQESGFQPVSQCETDLHTEMLYLLNESLIQQGPLSPDTFHTADNPLHRLTITYQNGSQQSFNLDISRAYVTEEILSNSNDLIDFFESIFTQQACN